MYAQVPTVVAIVLGVTVILLIGEIIPQAACKAYGIRSVLTLPRWYGRAVQC